MAKPKGGKRNQAEAVEREALERVAPVVERFGYKLWDVVFEKEGALWYLRVLFDKPDGGIDTDECEEISEPINKEIDKLSCLSLIDVAEAGSPGLYRRLRKPEHFRVSIGTGVQAQVKAENGERYVTGILEAYDEEKNEITVNGETLKLSKCIKVNAEPEEI